MLDDEAVEKYITAGQIAADVRDEVSSMIKEEMQIIDICNTAEEMIRSLGGEPAFPCNVSVNEVAAHYSSPPGDTRRIPEGSIVKVDVGVHIDGYIADTAKTICFNPDYEGLVIAAEKALERVIGMIHPGMKISDVSSKIQMVIESYGFKPISNLTGHQIGRYLIHAGKAVPNVSHISTSRFREGEVYAIEPFVTTRDASGTVKSGSEHYIFRFAKYKSPKNPDSRFLLNYIAKNFRTLPFSERWLMHLMDQERFRRVFHELLSSRSIMSYPIFFEATGRPVAQAEHTILLGKDGIIVLTKRD